MIKRLITVLLFTLAMLVAVTKPASAHDGCNKATDRIIIKTAGQTPFGSAYWNGWASANVYVVYGPTEGTAFVQAAGGLKIHQFWVFQGQVQRYYAASAAGWSYRSWIGPYAVTQVLACVGP